MVQRVTIPLEWANNIPGVSGVEDVSFQVPEVGDLVEAVDGTLPDVEDIREVVREELDEAVARIEDEVNVNVGNLEDLAADQIADAVLDRLDVEPGLFGPLSDPLDEVIRRAVRDGLEELEELDVSIEALDVDGLQAAIDTVADLPDRIDAVQDDVQTAVSRLEEFEVPAVEDIQAAVTTALTEALEELPGGTLLTDPDQFVDDQVDRIADRLVSDEAEEDLRAILEDIE